MFLQTHLLSFGDNKNNSASDSHLVNCLARKRCFFRISGLLIKLCNNIIIAADAAVAAAITTTTTTGKNIAK